MPKHICCAKCGMELKTIRKAIPHEGRVITIVEPHECDEELIKEFEKSGTNSPSPYAKSSAKELNKIFDSFPFVQKLNKASSEHEAISDIKDSGDKRDKKHLREEIVTSTAPLTVLNMIKKE